MIKQLTAALLLLAFMAGSFCHTAAVLDYYYNNTAAYAKKCENKSRPAMHCNGKCQLMKKLQQQEKTGAGQFSKKALHYYHHFLCTQF